MENEVLTYAPDAWVDEKDQNWYEVSFTKYFYKPVELRPMKDILSDLENLEKQAEGLMAEIVEGIKWSKIIKKKPSGAPWLGNIPSQWECLKLEVCFCKENKGFG